MNKERTQKVSKQKANKPNSWTKLTANLTWPKFQELITTYKSLSIIPLILLFFFYSPTPNGLLANLLSKLKFCLLTIVWASLGLLAGGLLLAVLQNKGQLIIDNTPDFLAYCAKSNGLVFFGPIGSGKTALLAMLAQELPGDNKYATFPCQLPWMDKSQIDFSVAPQQSLGVTETIFLDEINLLFKGNIVQDVRERQRFLMHFIALSRHQGTRVFANAQRLGQVSIEQREVTTAICQVAKLASQEEGIYVQLRIWEAAAWTNSKTEEGFVVFVPKKYLDTYNSYWLKSLKYLRSKQGYI